MPSLIDIRRRVRSVRNTQKITKAMKMISAAKLRRAQDRALASRPYATMLDQILSNVAEAAAQNADSVHPLLAVRPEKRILAIVITADKGLAGGFNSNLLKMAQRFLDQHHANELSLEVIGRKARDYFRRRTLPVRGEHLDLFRLVRYEDAERIADIVIDRFSKAEVDSVYLFVNEFKSVMAPNPIMTRILPIEVPKTATPVDYIYEQKPEEMLG